MAGVRRGVFTCVGWHCQVTLCTMCDPTWQVMSHSSEVGVPPGRAISAFTFYLLLCHSTASSSHDIINVVQVHSASGTRVTCVFNCQNEHVNRYIFSVAEKNATLGTAVTKSGKAFHAWVAATGKERSPNVARRDVSLGRLALTTKLTAGVDVTGRPSLAVDCQQGKCYLLPDTSEHTPP